MAHFFPFDIARHMFNRACRRSEEGRGKTAGTMALGNFSQDRVPSVPSCRVSPAGFQLIKQFEGCARLRPDGLYEAYPDPGTGGAPWTIGWGATGRDITSGTVWTKTQCDARLARDVDRHAAEVAAALAGCRTTQGQFDALVSFHFNTGAITRSTLARLHRKGDYEGAAKEFARWTFAGGKVLKGLVRRRREEARLYRSEIAAA